MSTTDELTKEEVELAKLIIIAVDLDLDIETVTPDMPIYGEGFGLDSIDILEVAMVVSQQYNVKLRSDDKNNMKIFASLRSLSEYIQSKRQS